MLPLKVPSVVLKFEFIFFNSTKILILKRDRRKNSCKYIWYLIKSQKSKRNQLIRDKSESDGKI